ncbi:SRPBCC family protein [Anabaena sphaerica FACHB-251]|uniref:SRPBCC family protein n=1 Tax=Anabaena sphaerica FACHB-251 TaxID=2692883 RepID=A0A926WHS3_9NOST|nr:SRPBCC family protein [Anabaena sphaerica]MBD2294723.1 SRPBCC family protein [Anabaena sphaerica FACHB-251]
MTEYKFITIWIIDAPIEKVWSEIINYPNWPTWWKYVERVIPIQDYHRFIWKTPLYYKIAFDTKLIRVQPPIVLELVAKGNVDGVGLWELESIEKGTLVRYTWKVKTTKAWMDILAIFIRPLMESNHNTIMEEGGKALAHLLGANLLSAQL